MRRVLASVVLLTAAVCHADMQASAQQPSGSLFESVPWLVKNQGPGTAKGVIYLIHGYDRLQPGIDDYNGVQPFVVGLNRQGWDVIGAKVPYRASGALATDLIGAIGRRVLDNLLPDRRLRVSPRIVKRAISKFQARGPNINRRSYKATLEINILTAGP